MFRIGLNLDDGTLGGTAFAPTIAGSVLSAPLYGRPVFRVSGFRPSNYLDVGEDLGDDPGLAIIVKRATGDQRFDGPPIIPSPLFTKTTGDATVGVYYEGALDLGAPAIVKDFGVDPIPIVEILTIECAADVSGSMAGRYVDFYITLEGLRPWFKVGGVGTAPTLPAGFGAIEVDVITNATATAMATALADAINGTAGDQVAATAVGAVVTITAKVAGPCGPHDAGDSGFIVTTTQAGGTGDIDVDVESMNYAVWLLWFIGDAPQISGPFTLTVVNTGYRPSSPPVLADTTRSRRAAFAIPNGTDTCTVTFATPFPTGATWVFRDVRVVNTLDGSPLVLFAGTMTARAASGFTLKLNGNTDSANYVLEYTADRT